MGKIERNRLFELFMDFTLLDRKILEGDPEGYVGILYDNINDAGFVLAPDKKIDFFHALTLQLSVESMIQALLPHGNGYDKDIPDTPMTIEGGGPLQVFAHKDNGESVVRRVETESITASAVVDRDHPSNLFDLGSSGVSGALFVLRIILLVEGVTRVKYCEQCGRIFLPKRADRKWCYTPRQCKNDFHRGKKSDFEILMEEARTAILKEKKQ